MDQKIIDAVIDTLKSGWITTGPKVKLFEEKLTAYGGHKATLCTNSASGGLELILRWFGLQEGDEVIVPAYTYSATANVVVHCGARVVFVDVGADFNIDVRKVEKAITENTKVIMPVDLAGFPCNYNALNALVNRSDIKAKFSPRNEIQQMLGRILVLSDAAHSVGAEYHGLKTGSLTDVTVYSFHAVKNLTTAEGGGAFEFAGTILQPGDLPVSQGEIPARTIKRCLFENENWRMALRHLRARIQTKYDRHCSRHGPCGTGTLRLRYAGEAEANF